MKQIILQSPVNWGVISVSLLLCIQTILEKRSNQLTAIAGQPFEKTVAGSPLSYGFIETVSTTNEYTNVTALTLGEHEASVEVGESVQLSATMSIRTEYRADAKISGRYLFCPNGESGR